MKYRDRIPIVFFAVLIALAGGLYFFPRDPYRPVKGMYATVTVRGLNSNVQVEFGDLDRIEELILQPLRSARTAPPMDYKILGHLTLHNPSSRSQHSIYLWYPFGTIEDDGQSKQVDFEPLRKVLLDRIDSPEALEILRRSAPDFRH